MSALPPDDMRQLRQTAFAARHPVDSMLARWEAIDAGTQRLAGLAGLGAKDRPASETGTQTRLVGALAGASEWQRELAWQGVQDVEAMLQSGLHALEVLESRGKDTRIPALTLWREVDAAQRGLMRMLSRLADEPAAPVDPA